MPRDSSVYLDERVAVKVVDVNGNESTVVREI